MPTQKICKDPRKDPCKRFACAIQKCLEAHNFQEAACEDALNALRECCAKWKEKSVVCDGYLSRFDEKDKEGNKVCKQKQAGCKKDKAPEEKDKNGKDKNGKDKDKKDDKDKDKEKGKSK